MNLKVSNFSLVAKIYMCSIVWLEDKTEFLKKTLNWHASEENLFFLSLTQIHVVVIANVRFGSRWYYWMLMTYYHARYHWLKITYSSICQHDDQAIRICMRERIICELDAVCTFYINITRHCLMQDARLLVPPPPFYTMR